MNLIFSATSHGNAGRVRPKLDKFVKHSKAFIGPSVEISVPHSALVSLPTRRPTPAKSACRGGSAAGTLVGIMPKGAGEALGKRSWSE